MTPSNRNTTGKHMRIYKPVNEHPIETIDGPALAVVRKINAIQEAGADNIETVMTKPPRISER